MASPSPATASSSTKRDPAPTTTTTANVVVHNDLTQLKNGSPSLDEYLKYAESGAVLFFENHER
jgi:hypothetical protein